MESHDREFSPGMTGPPFEEEPVKIAWLILIQENDNKVESKWLIAQAVDQLDAMTQLWNSEAFKESYRFDTRTGVAHVRIMPQSNYSGIIA